MNLNKKQMNFIKEHEQDIKNNNWQKVIRDLISCWDEDRINILQFLMEDCKINFLRYMDKIPSCCFWGCEFLRSIDIPHSIEKIMSYTFTGCSSLEYINIPNSVSYIGADAFRDCTSLKSIKIPERFKNNLDWAEVLGLDLNKINVEYY